MNRDTCEACGSISIKYYCESCDKVLCKKCGIRENKNNTDENRHYVVSLTQETFCSTHKTRYLTHQCSDCKEFVCDDSDHQHQHPHCVYILEKAFKLRQRFKEYASMIKHEGIESIEAYLDLVQSEKELLKKSFHFHRKTLKQMPFNFRKEEERINKIFNDESHHLFSALERRISLMKRAAEMQQEICDHAISLSHDGIQKILSEENFEEFDKKVQDLNCHGDAVRSLWFQPLYRITVYTSDSKIELQSEPYYFPYRQPVNFMSPPSIYMFDKEKKPGYFSLECFLQITQQKIDLSIITLIMCMLFYFFTNGIWLKVLGTISFFVYFACMMNSLHFNTQLW